MSIRHNCGKEKDLELSWVDPTGNTADRIKCNICGREFIDIIFIKLLKNEVFENNFGLTDNDVSNIEDIIDKLAGDAFK